MVRIFCYHCGFELVDHTRMKIMRDETCPNCHRHLHCCRNCRFYDEGAPQKCKETEAELVQDKTATNYCEYFEQAPPKISSRERSEDARKKLEDLFRKKS